MSFNIKDLKKMILEVSRELRKDELAKEKAKREVEKERLLKSKEEFIPKKKDLMDILNFDPETNFDKWSGKDDYDTEAWLYDNFSQNLLMHINEIVEDWIDDELKKYNKV